MNKTFILILALVVVVGCTAGPKVMLTKQIVQTTIMHSLYPDSLNSDTSKYTVEFHDIDIAKPHHTPHVSDTYGIPGDTWVFPVLASYTVTVRVQLGGGEPLYTVSDTTQKFLFYQNEFGNWALDMVSSSDNRSSERRFSGDQPPLKK